MEEYIYPNGRFWRSNFQVTTAFSIKGSSSLWKHLPAEHILMQLPKKKKTEGSQINSWKFKAHISWSQSDGDKMDYLLCANK